MVEWAPIGAEEYEKLKWALLNQYGYNLRMDVVGICEPPRVVLWINTGQESQADEDWPLSYYDDWLRNNIRKYQKNIHSAAIIEIEKRG